MIGAFLVGALLGLTGGWALWWSARREAKRAEEERQLLEQERMIVLECSHSMVEAIAEGKNREDLYREIVSAAIRATGAGAASIFERQADELRSVAVEGLFPPHRPLPKTGETHKSRVRFIEHVLREETFHLGEGLVGECARTGRGRLVGDAREDPMIVKHDDPALEIRSVVVAPIRFRDRNIGVLAVVNPIDGGAFTPTDLSLVESLGEQAGLALHNLDAMAGQIEQNKLQLDLSVANEIQGLLLPKRLPNERGLAFAAVYEAAQQVGGDLYDVFPLDDQRTGFVVADVSGKGVPASIVMALCQSNLRHLARQFSSPADVMRALNAELTNEMKRNMFVTMLYAVVDPAADTITLCRAGHESPVMVHAGEDSPPVATALEGPGIAVGLMPPKSFDRAVENRTYPFVPGDTLTVFTDGLTETRAPDGEEFGLTRLSTAALRGHNQGPGAINENIVEALAEFAGGRDAIEDDITLLTVQRVNPPATGD